MNPKSETQWAALAHLSALVALVGIPSMLGPLAVWFFKRESSELVADHAREAVNFHLSVILAEFILAIVILVQVFSGPPGPDPRLLVIVIFAIVGIAVASMVFSLIGAFHAAKGALYRYPVSLRLLS